MELSLAELSQRTILFAGMKKWITSNYHYMVPEYDETTKLQAKASKDSSQLNENRTLENEPAH